MEMRLILLKRTVQLKLHHILQVLDKDQLVGFVIIKHNTLLRDIENMKIVILPHLPYQPEPDAYIRTQVSERM